MKTLKLLAFSLVALFLVGCELPDDSTSTGGGGEVVIPEEGPYLHASKKIIYDNGKDATTFTFYYDGEVVESGYEIYLGENPFEGKTFTSTTQGDYIFWASYGTINSNEVTISVIQTPPAAPAAPEDTNPSKTNFTRRVLLTQFTGTGCGYCPNMMNILYTLSNNEQMSKKFVIAAAHLFNDTDPAYLDSAQTLDNMMAVPGYPSIFSDLDKASATGALMADVTSMINSAYDREMVRGGIAVNSEYHAEEGYIVLTATVKARTTTGFRIGAWLLEDNIFGLQGNNGITAVEGLNFNYHNNCIRIADSKYTDLDYTGYSLGVIEAGKTASREFAFKLKTNGDGNATRWNHDNLRVIVFISTKEGNKWLVNNVVKCPKDGSVDFEYVN